MFSIIENYKRLTLGFIKNNMAPEGPSKTDDKLSSNDFKGDGLSDLKALKKALKDGRIDTEEAKVINAELINIQDEAKEGLKEIADSILKEGFSSNDKSTYESFKYLIEASDSSIILPDFDSIIEETNNQKTFGNIDIKDKSFNLFIKDSRIRVTVDQIGTHDTLNLTFDTEGKVSSDGSWDEFGAYKSGVIDKDLLGDNISSIEKKQELESNINEILDEDILQLRIKDLEDLNSRIIGLINSLSTNNKPWSDYRKKLDTKSILIKSKIKELQSIENEQNDKQLIAWNKERYTEDAIRLIQKALLVKDDGDFGPNTLKALKKISPDGKVGLGVLVKLHLVKVEVSENGDKKYLLNGGLTSNMLREPRKGNISKIDLNKKTEPVQKNEKLEKTDRIKYGIDKGDVLKAAMSFLNENSSNSINAESTIGTYTVDGIEHKIVLKGTEGSYKVELEGTGILDDIDQEVLGNTVEAINKAVSELISTYQKELDAKKLKEQQEKENSFPKVLGEYKDFDGKEQNILLKDVSHPGLSEDDPDTPEYLVELDNSGKFIDPDVSFDHIPSEEEINGAIIKLKKEYNKEKQAKQEKLNKKDWKERQKEFDRVDIGETDFDKEVEERGLEDLDLSEEDIKILGNKELVHIDLSDIEKQKDGSYLIDIDGSTNLVVKKTEQGFQFTSDSGDFIFTDQTVNNYKDAIISGTKQLNEYIKTHRNKNTYDPTKAKSRR